MFTRSHSKFIENKVGKEKKFFFCEFIETLDAFVGEGVSLLRRLSFQQLLRNSSKTLHFDNMFKTNLILTEKNQP